VMIATCMVHLPVRCEVLTFSREPIAQGSAL
jgi:hypothetical protein